MVIYAGDWLYSSRNIRNKAGSDDDQKRTSALVEKVDNEIAKVLANQYSVNLTRTENPNPTGPVCIV